MHRRTGERDHAGVVRCKLSGRQVILAGADHPEELESIIRSTGFFHAKAQEPDGNGPRRRRALRTARCRRPDGGPRHPARRRTEDRERGAPRSLSASPGCRWTPTSAGSSKRLGLTTEDDPVKVEREFPCDPTSTPPTGGAMSLRLDPARPSARGKARTTRLRAHCSLKSDILPVRSGAPRRCVAGRRPKGRNGENRPLSTKLGSRTRSPSDRRESELVDVLRPRGPARSRTAPSRCSPLLPQTRPRPSWLSDRSPVR